MEMPKFLKLVILCALIIVSLSIVGCLVLNIYISANVTNYATVARKSFSNESEVIYAMINYINSNDYSLKERNNMVWAVGRLSDKRALSSLQALYTGEPCNHSLFLCQYELAKAINRCGGNVDYKFKDKKWKQK